LRACNLWLPPPDSAAMASRQGPGRRYFRNQGESELYSCRSEDCVWAAGSRRVKACRFLTYLCGLRSDQADALNARGMGDVNGLGDLGKGQPIIPLHKEHAPGPVGEYGCQPSG
jgi:hypothetical protein